MSGINRPTLPWSDRQPDLPASVVPLAFRLRFQAVVIAVMPADDLPGRLAITPDPLREYRIADLRAELQLLLESLKSFTGQALRTADAWCRRFVIHFVYARIQRCQDLIYIN